MKYKQKTEWHARFFASGKKASVRVHRWVFSIRFAISFFKCRLIHEGPFMAQREVKVISANIKVTELGKNELVNSGFNTEMPPPEKPFTKFNPLLAGFKKTLLQKGNC
ncbi:hypothetical protein TNCT_556031 [Trichonephila clavata]|uniref:Uncharacterized protein n=1 Tax=Trichonephila clavata TaxID=2740835 RepID=A0A8X6FW10_TRICU|nr:hypothetical protein TNCT_556031 [Trichonephila clavata]